MNKPEFPKARLIREDFLPEQDPLKNYRIKKVTKINNAAANSITLDELRKMTFQELANLIGTDDD